LAQNRTATQQIEDLNIPAQWMLSPKDKVTVTIPEVVNKRIDELSSQLALTKGLLFVVGFALLLKLLDDWMKGDK
jgi:hypothetical protein